MGHFTPQVSNLHTHLCIFQTNSHYLYYFNVLGGFRDLYLGTAVKNSSRLTHTIQTVHSHGDGGLKHCLFKLSTTSKVAWKQLRGKLSLVFNNSTFL